MRLKYVEGVLVWELFAREVAGGERGQLARLQQGMSELRHVIVLESAEGDLRRLLGVQP